MNTETIDHDASSVIVVGGGLAGLTAAAYLARAGQSVSVFEKSPALGGRAATQYFDGFALNRGVHALYTGGAASEVLLELGVNYHAGTPRVTFALRDEKVFPLPLSPASLLTSGLLGLRDKLALIRVFATLPGVNPHDLAYTSVADWLDLTISRPAVKQLLTAFARTFVYSAALDLVSAEVFVDKLQRSLKHPVHYIDYGWQTLVDGLRNVAVSAGAHVETGMRVDAIEHHDGRLSGVRLTNGKRLAASGVILATTPGDAVNLVGESADQALNKRVNHLVPARLACLDLALSRLPSPMRPAVQDLDGPLFLTAQSSYARVAPAGAAVIHAFKQLDERFPTTPHQDEQDLEQLLDRVQSGWREYVVKRVYLPRMAGATALPLACDGGFAGRPGPRIPGLAGVYLAGDWVGAAGFLADASLASAREAARLVLVDAGRDELRAASYPASMKKGQRSW